MLERLQELGGNPLVLRPGEGEPFDAVRVGVLRGGEPAVGEAQLAEDVVERLLDNRAVASLACDHPCVEVRRGEQRVVVEHLLEVRHEPAVVDGVAMKAAADEVVHGTRGHPVERLHDHRVRSVGVAPKQELERRGGWELRRSTKAAVHRLERLCDPSFGLGEQARRERVAGRLQTGGLADALDEPSSLRHDVVPLRLPGLVDGEQELNETTAARGGARAGSTYRRRTARRQA